jgi:hypothetical protein
MNIIILYYIIYINILHIILCYIVNINELIKNQGG